MFALWLTRQWFQRRRTPALWLLQPLAWLYGVLAERRRRRTQPVALPVPVIVIGNLIVGGAGKTPLTLALAEALRARGWQPGIVSRGYGSDRHEVRAVDAASTPDSVGDEPLLLARRSGVPVFVGRDRVAAGQALLAAHPAVDVVLCDDGLQHYRLQRQVELAVFDQRGIGNGALLPAGPLREPLSRLARVDAVVGNGGLPQLPGSPPVPGFVMSLQPGRLYRLSDPACQVAAGELGQRGKPLFALAGIGHPERFFATLAGLGLRVETRAFPDHHAYRPEDLAFAGDGLLLMTEKDAVKCAAIAGQVAAECWVLPVSAELPPALIDLIVEKLRGRSPA